MENKNGVILGVLIVISIVIVGIYLLSPVENNPEPDDTESTDNGTATSTVEDEIRNILGEGDYDIEVIPIDENEGGIDVPNIHKPLPDDIAADTRKEMENLISLLDEDLENHGAWVDLASYRRLTGDLDGAEEIWIFMSKAWVNDLIAYINLGDLYHFYKKDYPKSEENYKLAIKSDPNYIPNYIKLHELYKFSYEDKSDLADDALLDGLTVHPNDMVLLANLGEYYKQEEDTENAKKYFLRVAEEAEKKGDTETAELFTLKADTL